METWTDVAKVMRQIRAQVIPAEAEQNAQATAPNMLAPHKQEMERLLLHVEGTRQQAAAHANIGDIGAMGGARGFVARLVRKMAAFIIRPQVVVNQNVAAAVEGLLENDRELLRALDTLQAAQNREGAALQEGLQSVEQNATPFAQLHYLTVQNAALAVEIKALQDRLAALEAGGEGTA